MNEQQRVTISVDALNKVLGVLGSLPYQQVAQVIQEVQHDVKPVLEAVDTEKGNEQQNSAKA